MGDGLLARPHGAGGMPGPPMPAYLQYLPPAYSAMVSVGGPLPPLPLPTFPGVCNGSLVGTL